MKIVYDDGVFRQEYDLPTRDVRQILRNARRLRREAWEDFGRVLPPTAWRLWA